MKHKIYEVTWYDAHFHDEAMYPENIKKRTKPFIMRDVGFYVGESKIDFKIAQEKQYNERYAHIMCIPKSTYLLQTNTCYL